MSIFDEDCGDVVLNTSSIFLWQNRSYRLALTQYERFAFSVKVQHHSLTGNSNSSATEHELVGVLQGTILPRPSPHFFEFADEVSSELQELAVTFCNAKGTANRIQHPTLVDDTEAVHGGGFLQIYTLEVKPSERGRLLGLRILHETLKLLHSKWTLAVMMPSSLSPRFCHWKENAPASSVPNMEENDMRVKRHFCRMGFSQAAQTGAWFLTRQGYFGGGQKESLDRPISTWLSKAQASQIEVLVPPQLVKPTGVNQLLADKVAAFVTSTPTTTRAESAAALLEIEDLVLRQGASIHDAGVFQLAVTGDDEKAAVQLLPTLIRLGGNVNHVDALGNTALHVAASQCQNQSITYLLGRGANKSLANTDGKTPLQCLKASGASFDDFEAAMGLKLPLRAMDVLPKLESHKAFMSPRVRSLLVDGWMSPRMKEVLLTTAQNEHHRIFEPYDRVPFVTYKPTSIARCCDRGCGIHRVDYIPASVLTSPINANGLYESFYDGWGNCFEAIEKVLQDGGTPTVHRVHHYLNRGDGLYRFDARKYRHFLDKGGMVEFAIDAVIDISRNVVISGDDGWEYWEIEDEIAALPATSLDAEFDIVRFKCIHEGGGVGTFTGPYRETSRLGDEEEWDEEESDEEEWD